MGLIREDIIAAAHRGRELIAAGIVALAGLWVFLFMALATFSSADWPSHTVAVHANPASNLMGRLGAGIAYWTYLSMGFGVWLPMIASAVALAATASGREVSHPAIRTFGAVVMMLALSSLHATWFGTWGVLAGAEAGLVPQWISNQLLMHFSPTLASLVLMISLSLGNLSPGPYSPLAIAEARDWRTCSYRGRSVMDDRVRII
jgi:hypothetical protein